MSEEGKFNELGMEYYSATPKAGYKPRGNAPWGNCYHVKQNTESGSAFIDNRNRDIDHNRQHQAIGGREVERSFLCGHDPVSIRILMKSYRYVVNGSCLIWIAA